MSVPDPTGWPALLHRLTTSWSALLRLLIGVAVIVAVITAALCVLGDVTVQVGPFGVELRPAPTMVLSHADGSGAAFRHAHPVQVGGDHDLAAEHLGGLVVEQAGIGVAL